MAEYTFFFNPMSRAQIARWALHEAGADYEPVLVKWDAKPPELLAASPAATVPVLVLPAEDGRVIAHSLDIMLWTLRRHDPLDWLVPATGTLEDLLALVDACDTGFKADLDRYKYPDRHPRAPGPDLPAGADAASASAHRHRDRGAAFLDRLEDRLAHGPYLAGGHATLADAAILPFVRQFAATDPGYFDALPLPALRDWLERYLASPVFAAIMPKFEPWAPHAAPMAFPA